MGDRYRTALPSGLITKLSMLVSLAALSCAKPSILIRTKVIAAPAGTYLWSKQVGGAGYSDTAYPQAVAVDGSGNVVVTGYFEGTVDFGGGPLTSAAGSPDVFLAKYSPTGAHLWSKRFGDTNVDIGFGVAIDAGGNVIATGYLMNTVDFGGGPLPSVGGSDIFLVKFSPTGVHLWSKRLGGPDSDTGNAVTVDGDGNVMVTGSFGSSGGPADLGGGLVTGSGRDDIFVAKYSGADGTHLWSKHFGDTRNDIAYGIASDQSGNVVVTGFFQNTVNFGGGPLTSAGGEDIFVAKYAGADGSHLWSKRLGGPSDDEGAAIATAPSGDIVVTGYFNNTVDFGGGPLANAAGSDVFLVKYAGADGRHLWSKNFGTDVAFGDAGKAVATDSDGDVLLTGLILGADDFGGGPLWPDYNASCGCLSYDTFVAKFSGDGEHRWSKRYGGLSDEKAGGVAVDRSGYVVATGSFYLSINFGGGTLTNTGGYDGFVAKLTP